MGYPLWGLTGRIFKASLSEQSHSKVSLSSHLVNSDIFFFAHDKDILVFFFSKEFSHAGGKVLFFIFIDC